MRNAVVTGAGSGLGRAVAHELAARGWRVRVTDVDPDGAARVAAEAGAEASASVLDVRDASACETLAAELAADGGIELWVNNAGVLFSGPPWEQSAEQRALMMDVNATGLMNGTLAALGPMRAAGRGHVLNVVSLAGLVAAPGEVAYSASKHAAMAFTLGCQFDLRREGVRGVRVSAVCPDGIWTPMIADKLEDTEAAGSFSGQLQRVEDVAATIAATAESPRAITVIPRWRGPQVRFFDAFPGLAARMLPVVMWDARRRQRRYRRLIEAGRWP